MGVAMPKMPIQKEPESTVGRKPAPLRHPDTAEHGRTRSGAGIREGDESEAGSEISERDRGEPPTAPDREG
jgi:hypothetical protein